MTANSYFCVYGLKTNYSNVNTTSTPALFFPIEAHVCELLDVPLGEKMTVTVIQFTKPQNVQPCSNLSMSCGVSLSPVLDQYSTFITHLTKIMTKWLHFGNNLQFQPVDFCKEFNM